MQNLKYTIAFLLSAAVICPQAYAMKRCLKADMLPQLMARRYVSSGAMDVNQAFRVLGLSSATSLKQMREKYHELLKAHHPDRNRNSKASTDKTKEINQAYKLVKEYLENRPQPNPAGAQQGNQQQSSRSSYSSQNTYNAGYNTHNQQYGQARSNHSSNDRQRYEDDWSPSSSSSMPYFFIGGIGLFVTYHLITYNYKQKRLEYPKTPLHIAIRKGDKKRVGILLKDGANPYLPEGAEGKGKAPLQLAVQYGDKEMVEMLIEVGAGVDFAQCGIPLSVAIERGSKDIVEVLLEAGANANVKGNGSRLLDIAIEKGHKDIVEMLLEAGASLFYSEDEKSPLKRAIERGSKDIVEMLLKAGADVDASLCYDSRPLHCAIDRGRKDIVEMLLKAGARTDNCYTLRIAV